MILSKGGREVKVSLDINKTCRNEKIRRMLKQEEFC